MIAGIFIRYFKTYRGWKYIPLSIGDQFCGLVGDNGVGKSSVLEALDCFFNNKNWNHNLQTKKSGIEKATPTIVPLFLLNKEFFNEEQNQVAEKLDLGVKNFKNKISSNAQVFNDFRRHFEKLNKFSSSLIDSHFLIPLGETFEGELSFSIFDNIVEEIDEENLKSLRNHIKKNIDYLYIPKELDSETFTKLENQEVQVLMGEGLNHILGKIISDQQITAINTGLNQFITQISNELDDLYTYRMPNRDRQVRIKRTEIFDLLIESYFSIKTLHKRQGDHWLEINALSSGEKQKAIIDIAKGLLKNHRQTGENLIIAIDEPESSLHMSACFDQFQALYEISKNCMQSLFSTHWYGFLPIVESGTATVIRRENDEHQVDLLDISSHREEIREMRDASSRENILPYNIRLKSINDFIQSIVSSVCAPDPYYWILCEGSTEKLYLSEYFKEEIKKHKLRIVPVGGAADIKRINNHLMVIYDDSKIEFKGKIILLSDTDTKLVSYAVSDSPHIRCRRLIMNRTTKEIDLVKPDSDISSPVTAIEDCLESELFINALKNTAIENEAINISTILSSIDNTSEALSGFALDLKPTELDEIKLFLNQEGIKYKVAKEYSRLQQSHESPPPLAKWILEIKEWLYESNSRNVRRSKTPRAAHK